METDAQEEQSNHAHAGGVQFITQQGDIVMSPPAAARARPHLLWWLLLPGTAAILTGISVVLILTSGERPSSNGSPTASAAPTTTACFVTAAGVKARSGPGPEFPVVVTIGEGQGFVPYESGRPDEAWYVGDLWGGEAGVWVDQAHLDCP